MNPENELVESLIYECRNEPDFLLALHFDAPGVQKHKVAHIADTLSPEVDKYLQKNSRMLIVGNDGFSITQEDYRWSRDILRWLELGCEIQYLLRNPTSAALDKLAAISKEAKRNKLKGKLWVFRLDHESKCSASDSNLIQQIETFHFVVFENPAQLWVEVNHPAGSTEAFDCSYFPPEAAKASALHGLLKSRFEHFVEAHATLVKV